MRVRQQILNDLSSIEKVNRDRVLIVGPVLPYRGGIAQHTTMLHRALRDQADSLTISFSRQYPKWIFPGENDKDEKLAGYQEPGVEYIIDSINPLSWMQAVKRIREFAPRLVIFPWWHVYWVPGFAWISKQLKKDNIEVVFFCHNAVEHEDANWKRFLTDFVLNNANRFIVHTLVDKESLVKRLPDIPVSVHPHPIYDQFPQSTKKLPRRAKLELLFFGFVRPYKGLDVLLKAMTLLKEEDVFLSIVGEFWHGEDETLEFIANNGIDKKVEIIARYVPDDEAASYFARCDVVVLPYHSATGSGVIPLAYHYCKPVVVTHVGGLPDVVEEGLTGILIPPGSSIHLSKVIRKIISDRSFFTTEGIESIKTRLTWDGLAKVCLDR